MGRGIDGWTEAGAGAGGCAGGSAGGGEETVRTNSGKIAQNVVNKRKRRKKINNNKRCCTWKQAMAKRR